MELIFTITGLIVVLLLIQNLRSRIAARRFVENVKLRAEKRAKLRNHQKEEDAPIPFYTSKYVEDVVVRDGVWTMDKVK